LCIVCLRHHLQYLLSSSFARTVFGFFVVW